MSLFRPLATHCGVSMARPWAIISIDRRLDISLLKEQKGIVAILIKICVIPAQR